MASSFNPNPGTGFTPWASGYSGAGTYASFLSAPSPTVTFSSPPITPVSPTFDPKIDANQLYGKAMTLAAIGSKPVRFGGSPAPIVGPYINGSTVDFLVSIALIVPVDGTRKLFTVYLDQEKAWSSATGWDGTGAQPGDAIYHAEIFDLAFRPGTLTQTVCSLETAKFPGDENAYRPQVLIEIRNLPYQRFMDQSGRPVPYVSADIGDFSNGRGPDEQINLGEALELIAHSPWAGYTSGTFEAVNITDAVDGILIKDNFTVVDLCRSVTRIYRNIDLLQSDKLRVKDRGNVSPDFIFDRDTIIGGENPIQIIRGGATVQRRELELLKIDPDQDYTITPSLSKIPRDPFVISAAVGKETITSPLVMDAATGQSLVTYAQQYEENARRKIALTVMAFGYQIEPGDLFATVDVQDGIDNEVWKVTQTEHLGDFTVALEAEAILRCQRGYIPPAAGFLSLYNATFSSGSGPFINSNTSVDLGAEASDRVIALTIGSIRSIPTGRTILAVTINGVAAILYGHIIKNGSNPVNHPGSVTGVIAVAEVPTGTTGTTVEIVTDGLTAAISFGVHRLTGLSSAVPFDSASASTTGGGPSLSLDVPSNGIVIANYAGCEDPGSVLFSGVTPSVYNEQVDATGNGFWCAAALQTGLIAQTSRTIDAVTPAIGAEVLVAVSFA